MNTHVFIVDETTFKLHLEYLFAGTGAGNCKSVFLTDPSKVYPKVDINGDKSQKLYARERNMVALIADISRIRVGDNIVFYLEKKGIGAGRFFGVFEAASKAFFDENDQNNYLVNQLGKGLSFRLSIKPKTVYSKGVTEHTYLDSLNGISAPHELCWSMIYRKLKGKRGCTMITNQEYWRLLRLLKNENPQGELTGKTFTFDETTSQICQGCSSNAYKGRKKSLNIFARLKHMAQMRKSFESHLQAYIMQNYDTIDIQNLLNLGGGELWTGNEVYCGVGLQKIDSLFIKVSDNNVWITIVEIKDEKPVPAITSQISWYIEWVSDYIVPHYSNLGMNVYIQPCIIAKKTNDKTVLKAIKDQHSYTVRPTFQLQPTKLIDFNIINTKVKFSLIP